MERAVLTMTEAAQVLGIDRSTAYELHKRGEFPVRVLTIGRRLKVPRVALDRYLSGGGGAA